ncbi:hypothetical protein HDU83_004180 [Entophlyctis luteolus]|nr:hypothetical protein HDU83_004180 [Entophlyctis luteolus]
MRVHTAAVSVAAAASSPALLASCVRRCVRDALQLPQSAGAAGSATTAALLFIAPGRNTQLPVAACRAAAESLHSSLKAYFSREVPSIGALVSSISQPYPTNSLPDGSSNCRISVSLLHTEGDIRASAFKLDSSFTSASPFRSDKPVGRWFDALAGRDLTHPQNFNVDQFKSMSRNSASVFATETSKSKFSHDSLVKSLVFADENGLESNGLLMTISDKDPNAVWNAFSHSLPALEMVGLISPMTPFITGLENTLFMNGSVVDGGLVGLSLANTSKVPASKVDTVVWNSYPHLLPIGNEMEITSCRGNIILTLNTTHATEQILSSISSAENQSGANLEGFTNTISSDNALYISIRDSSASTSAAVHRIVAGDLAKGNIAVDTQRDLHPGMRATIMYLPKKIAASNPDARPISDAALRFEVLRQDDEYTPITAAAASVGSDSSLDSANPVVFSGLVIGSDAGIMHKAGSTREVCRVPFATVQVN